MSGAWFIFSAREPAKAEAVLECCLAHGRGGQRIEIVRDDELLGIGPRMQEVYEREPELDFYGWLADDTFPLSDGWNVTLAEAAGPWGLSYAADGGYIVEANCMDGSEYSSGLCWGGELVRSVGWWALPGLRSAWIDVAWQQIVRPLGLHRYRADVLVRHDHWRNGRRAKDELDVASEARIALDLELYGRWVERELPELLERVRGELAEARAA